MLEYLSLLLRQAERVRVVQLGEENAQRRLRAAFQYLKVACKKYGEGLSTRASSDRKRGSCFK